MGGGTLGARAEGGVELGLSSRAGAEEMKIFWKGMAGMISQNNGCSVSITCEYTRTHKYIQVHYTCTCAHVNTHKHTHTYVHKRSDFRWVGPGAEQALEQERTGLRRPSVPFSQKVCPGKPPLSWPCLWSCGFVRGYHFFLVLKIKATALC